MWLIVRQACRSTAYVHFLRLVCTRHVCVVPQTWRGADLAQRLLRSTTALCSILACFSPQSALLTAAAGQRHEQKTCRRCCSPLSHDQLQDTFYNGGRLTFFPAGSAASKLAQPGVSHVRGRQAGPLELLLEDTPELTQHCHSSTAMLGRKQNQAGNRQIELMQHTGCITQVRSKGPGLAPPQLALMQRARSTARRWRSG